MVSNLTVKIGADIAGLQKELNKATGQLQGFSKGMAAIGGVIAGAFAADKIIDFGKQVFDVTAEFQKFEAVLTNTLGHNGAAKAALSEITQFASKTPYQVNELTASFVKLANQGFIPTLENMRSLGDLASSQGKSFDMLTEAIIDAQTGEFERLKEFGIRASKEGDRVTFTFKGVKQQVDFTSDSIRKYILSLGDVEGVSGGMDAQSKTLGGGLSNLKDNWDQLTLAIGKSLEKGGMFSGVMDAIASSVKGLANFISPASINEQAHALQELIKLRQAAARSGDIEEWARLNNIIQQGTESVREWWEGQKKLKELQNQVTPAVDQYGDALERINGLMKSPTMKPNNITGAGFLQDMGVEIPSIASIVTQGLAKINTGMIVSAETVESWASRAKIAADSVAQKFKDIAPMLSSAIGSGITSLAQGFGEMAAGVGSFGDVVLKAVAGFATQFGSALIAAGTAAAIAKNSLLARPELAIAAGIALVGIGAALSASAKQAHQSNFSGGGGSSVGGGGRSSSPARISNPFESGQIQLGGVIEVAGDKLLVVLKNAEAKNKVRRG